MARFGSRSRLLVPHSGTRRKTGWSVGPSGLQQRTSSGSGLFTTGAQVLLQGTTIVRIRGIFQVFLNSVAAALDGYTGAVGITEVSLEAFNAGIGSIPTPVTDMDRNIWLWHQFFSIKTVGAAIGDGASNTSSMLVQIDSKAMRKSSLDSVMVAVLEQTEVGTATMQARIDTRMLSKLP